MKSSRLVCTLWFCVLTSLTGGCIAVVALAGGAAVGSVAYVKGELHAPLDHPLPACHEATAQAVESLGLVKISETGDGVCARFELRNARNTAITIRLERLSDSATQVHIRVGTFGDQSVSLRILDEIKSHL